MTELTPVARAGAGEALDAVAVGVLPGPDGPVLAAGADGADRACGGRLAGVLALLGATGRAEEVTLVPADAGSPVPLVAAVGLGPATGADGSFEPEALRRASGAVVRALAGRDRVGSTLALVNGPHNGRDERDVRAVGEGALLGAYAFTRYTRGGPDGPKPPVREVILTVTDPDGPATARAVGQARTIATTVHFVRDLVNTPGNHLYPANLADLAAERGRAAGLDVEVLDEVALAEGGYGGISGVGAGSARPPRLVRLSYRPPAPARRIALVGKGITFDSGGLTLKSREGLLTMKNDMSAAAAVLGAVLAVAELDLPVAVDAYLPLAENMPGGSAYRPGDVLRMRNGLHVEIRNTDAEGRMVLADAVARACEDRPDHVISTATLTGAQRIALGRRTAGVMGDPFLTRRLEAAGADVGEPTWPMPVPEDIPEQLASDVADMANWAPETAGGMQRGALFVSRFVPAGISFAHLDVASVTFNTGQPRGYVPVGATGTPTRTLVRALEDLASTDGA